jgi:hypothetical protein
MERTAVLAVLAEAYRNRAIAADQLPYTDDFEALYRDVVDRTGTAMTRAEFWHAVTYARKRGLLPRLMR